MIVISSSLTLIAGAGELDPTLPLIGYHNLVDTDNVVADTEQDGFPAVNLANPATFLKWKGTTIEESPAADHQYLTVATGYVDQIDYIAVAGHNFGTAAIAVTVEGRTSSVGNWTQLVQQVLLPDDSPALFRFTAQSLESIRLKLEDGDDDPEAAVLYTGKLLVMERGLDIGTEFTPIDFGRVTNVVSGASEFGAFLGRIVLGEQNQSEAAFKWLTPDWYRDSFDTFARAAREAPFFFAWWPDEYPREVGYCWATDNITPQTDPVTRRVHVTIRMGGVS